ncbi:hypothetical protein ACFQ3N_05305 [Virgibacillus byunsanensis]|uniref:Lipoprotein n=1 Tax=Virgibacillus byunsanensis TaxID=570945 RepID=A0ABW3LKK8_9BACI
MINRTRIILLFFVVSFLLVACQNDGNEGTEPNDKINNEQKQEVQNYLYESKTVKVIQTPGWQLQDNSSKDKDNIMFQNENVKAILTSVSHEKSLDEIKSELKASFGNSDAIEEDEQYLSLKSNRKESIRTDIYLNSGEEQTGILIFMTPHEGYEINQELIKEFKQSVQFF